MAMAKKIVRREWTKADVKQLKTMAKARVGVTKISKSLKRTPGATSVMAAKLGVSLSMRPLVKLVTARLGAAKGNSIYLLSLFPGNPAKLAAKFAGLPRPTNCL